MKFGQKILIALTLTAALVVSFSCAKRQSTTPSSPQSVTSSTQPNPIPPPPSLGWDLTYESVLSRNGIGPDALIWEWAQAPYRPPVNKLVTEWQGEPIVSSVLMELQGPSGDQHAYWFARTMNHAFYWEFENGEIDDHHVKEPIPVQKYDEAFKAMSSWQQAPDSGEGGLTGSYFGFLSLYDGGKSRQMLLTVDDLGSVDRHGRLLQVTWKLLENVS